MRVRGTAGAGWGIARRWYVRRCSLSTGTGSGDDSARAVREAFCAAVARRDDAGALSILGSASAAFVPPDRELAHLIRRYAAAGARGTVVDLMRLAVLRGADLAAEVYRAALSVWTDGDIKPPDVVARSVLREWAAGDADFSVELFRALLRALPCSVDAVVDALKDAQLSKRDRSHATSNLVIALVDLGRHPEALSVAKGVAYLSVHARHAMKLGGAGSDGTAADRGRPALEWGVMDALRRDDHERARLEMERLTAVGEGDVSDRVLADLAHAFLRAKDPRSAAKCVEAMGVGGPRIAAAVATMQMLRASGDVVGCTRLFAAVPRSPNALGLLVDALADRGRAPDALAQLLESSRDGVTPLGRSFARVIRDLCTGGDLEGARGAFDEMRRLGIAEEGAFSALSTALLRRKRFSEAWSVISDMMGALPDRAASYNRSMNYCLEMPARGGARAALELFDSMSRRQVRPDGASYNAVIRAYGKIGQLQSSRAALNAAVQAGLAGVLCYNALLGVLTAHRRDEEAVRLASTMRERGVAYDQTTLYILLKLFTGSRSFNLAEMEALIAAMQEAGLVMQETHVLPVMHAYATVGDMGKVEEVFSGWCRANRPSVKVYNALVRAYVRNRDQAGAEAVLDRMRLALLQPEVSTYAILARGLNDADRHHSALELVQRARSSGIPAKNALLREGVRAADACGDDAEVLALCSTLAEPGARANLNRETFVRLLSAAAEVARDGHSAPDPTLVRVIDAWRQHGMLGDAQLEDDVLRLVASGRPDPGTAKRLFQRLRRGPPASEGSVVGSTGGSDEL